jgi:hypothetical protein
MKQSYVDVTPLWYVPGAVVLKHIGRIHQHIIRETTISNLYGIFEQHVLMEVNSIISSYAAAIGGNAILNYHVKYLVSKPNYIMLSVYGDAVYMKYPKNDSSFIGLNLITELSNEKENAIQKK